jgi:hypothetical protein
MFCAPAGDMLTVERSAFTVTVVETVTALEQLGVTPLSVIEVSVYVVVEPGVTVVTVPPEPDMVYVLPSITRS